MGKIYKMIGVMSGTSLDGLDLTYCEFQINDGKWSYEMPFTKHIPYDTKWVSNLSDIENRSAIAYAALNVRLGEFIGRRVREFIDLHQLTPDFICSHGHTIYHQPEVKITTQIGSGASIAAESGIPTICDFRTMDVALGGQGAPLVPVGDRALFSEYDYCLNLGGIANISCEIEGQMMAFDIAPANMPLNHYMKTLGKSYDDNGNMARSGKVNQVLLEKLQSLDYYEQEGAKSLGKEWVLDNIIHQMEEYRESIEDVLATSVEHTAYQIGASIKKLSQKISPKNGTAYQLLITGGGAYNSYLIERIQYHLGNETTTHIPDGQTVNFKEALIFAFLGVLRLRNEVNCLSSVTGAQFDHVGGVIYNPLPPSVQELEQDDEPGDFQEFSGGDFKKILGCG